MYGKILLQEILLITVTSIVLDYVYGNNKEAS